MGTSQPRNHTTVDTELAHVRVQQRLSAVDQRYTKGRRQLVELLLAVARPATLPELAQLGPDLPTSSMYRNLELLERHGLVQRIATGAGHAHFELSEPILGHHHHLICVTCGRVDDIELDDAAERIVERALESAAATVGFVPLHHTADLHGHCQTCDTE